MKQVRRHLTYANVMSSIAVFLILGGATAVAATKIGANELKANSVKTGKIVKEAVTQGKIKNSAVTEAKIADGAVTTAKIANDAVTGEKVKESTLSEVPSAANAQKLAGQSSSAFVARNALLWALVNENGNLVAGSGATAATQLGTGNFRVTFDREIKQCVTAGGATDVSGGLAPEGNATRIVSTDNRLQANPNTMDVVTTNPAGTVANPEPLDGFMVTVYC